MKTVSATEAKNRLGALINDVVGGDGAITIQHHGRPSVVVVSAEEWAEVSALRERVRREAAWQRIKEIAREVSARNADLTQEEVDALADEIGDEAKRRAARRLMSE